MGGLFGDDIAGRIASQMYVEGPHATEAYEMFSMSLRVPEPVRAMIDAMASAAGVSRNVMSADLLRAGIQSVLSSVPAPIADELREEAGGYM